MQLSPSYVVVQRQKFIVMISAELHTHKKEVNRAASLELKHDLESGYFSYQPNHGMYKNTSETSFAVVADTLEDIDTLQKLAWLYEQESILVINQASQCFLVYMDRLKPEEYIGKWTEVTKTVAEDSGNYTERDGKYFICDLGGC